MTVTDGVPVEEALAGADGAPLVVAVRDAYRSDWQAAWLRRLVEQRPDAIVVAVGMPDDADLVTGAVVTSHGAARVSTDAVADALAGRTSP